MTNSEFSDTFTTLLNSYNTQAQFGKQASDREIVLDEYEKSVLLTQAQDIIVKSYFDGTLNSQRQGFDDSSRRQVDFSSLIKVATLQTSESANSNFDDRGILYDLPKKTSDTSTSSTEVLFILNEKLIFTPQENSGFKQEFVIVPINYKEYDREMSKPYAQPLKKQAWRLFQNTAVGFDLKTELIPRWDYKKAVAENHGVFTYKIRYIKRPQPIILENLPDGLEIDGEKNMKSCELNPIIHMDILNKAVELAISSRGGAVSYRQPQQGNNQERS